MTEDRAALDGFSGVARLFPLPNLVLFPGVDQGLHIFEPRYRQMTADALASDQMIAMVLLTPNPKWDEEYDGRPAIEPVACLGRVKQSERLPDGRYNLRLRGLARFRIEAEVPDTDKLYRLARGHLVPDITPTDLPTLAALRRELRDVVLARFDPAGAAHQHLRGLFDGDTPLAGVCDSLGYGLPLPLEAKQRLLAEADVTARVRLLAALLRPTPPPGRHFPPVFSPN